ncbi:MAG: universal stress protein [Rhodothermales bacterium]|nr:universal stress protein [Rhodothermales bacterium]
MPELGQILVATDYSDCSRAALQQAAGVAGAVGARLHVVHVIESLSDGLMLDAYESPAEHRAFEEALLSTSRQLMGESLKEIGLATADVITEHLTSHSVVDALLDYVARLGVDLLVVGTHGRRGIRRLLLGSVARAVVASADTPVLIARDVGRGRDDLPYKRVMVPVDLSPNSVRGLSAGRQLAALFQAQLDVVHVLERYVFPVSLSKIKTARDLVPDIESKVRSSIQGHLEKLEGPYVPYTIHVREGDPASCIIDMAQESACDLIVMTRRGLSASERFVVGSVTQKVSQAAHCSVYVEPE